MTETVRMCDLRFDSSLFENYLTGTVLDRLLCSYSGLPKGVNYMVIVYAVEWHSCVLFLQAKKRKEYAEQKYFVCQCSPQDRHTYHTQRAGAEVGKNAD